MPQLRRVDLECFNFGRGAFFLAKKPFTSPFPLLLSLKGRDHIRDKLAKAKSPQEMLKVNEELRAELAELEAAHPELDEIKDEGPPLSETLPATLRQRTNEPCAHGILRLLHNTMTADLLDRAASCKPEFAPLSIAPWRVQPKIRDLVKDAYVAVAPRGQAEQRTPLCSPLVVPPAV